MSVVSSFAQTLKESLPKNFTIDEINTKKRHIYVKWSDNTFNTTWCLKFKSNAGCELWGNDGLTRRIRTQDHEDIVSQFMESHQVWENEYRMRQVGAALCEYIAQNGLPENYHVINNTSNKSGGHMTVRISNTPLTIRTTLDPPLATIETHGLGYETFHLNDPQCASDIKKFINEIL